MEITLVSVVIFTAGVLLSTGLFLYIFPQIALIDLPLLGILRNAVLLFLGFLPRSIGGIVVLVAYWGRFCCSSRCRFTFCRLPISGCRWSLRTS